MQFIWICQMEIAALSEAVGKVRGCVCRAAHRGCGFQAARPRFSCESENFFVLQESFLCDSDYLRFCKKIFLIPRVRFLQIPDFIDFARKASCKHRSPANSAAVCQIQPQSGKFSRSLPNQPRPAGICCTRHPSAILSLTSAPASSNLARRSATWSFFFSSPLTS